MLHTCISKQKNEERFKHSKTGVGGHKDTWCEIWRICTGTLCTTRGRSSSSHQCTQSNVYLPYIKDHTIAVSEPKILLTSIVSFQMFILTMNIIIISINKIIIIIIIIIIRVIVIIISSTLRPHLPES